LDTRSQVLDKVREEIEELEEALTTQKAIETEAEFGDLLFSLVNYARFIHVDPEAALERTNKKFKARFHHMEELAAAQGLPLHELNLEEMDALWDQAKKILG
jgi:uncharacterized protein YabN with tetrapyrrole methylase and pyrophosphatase domain